MPVLRALSFLVIFQSLLRPAEAQERGDGGCHIAQLGKSRPGQAKCTGTQGVTSAQGYRLP